MRMSVTGIGALCLLLTSCGGLHGHPVPATDTPGAAFPTSKAAAATPGTTLPELTAWVQGGESVDRKGFHTVTREGATTDLGDDVAFTSPSQKIKCMTSSKMSPYAGGLSCLVQLVDPPARPAAVPADSNWVGGWLDYPGDTLNVGAQHGDPGQFVNGYGSVLNYGNRLTFGDYDCRMDSNGLTCVDKSAGSGVRINDSGVQPVGCLQRTDPGMHGLAYACAGSESSSPETDSTTTTAPATGTARPAPTR
ncbi:hypothetical protein NRB56_67550 [Nocardia sp. RB56]|uniref:Lipoprotein LppI n=2 Tax=Nocardia aurantia TaxID=2585199 RepID=A0A7K0E036_9NOCA|nr:hypothetical protein [Nocardia aurantia]